MSGEAALLNCPVCFRGGSFQSIESLRNRLLHISTQTILCPVCQDEVNGVDKLILHLHEHLRINVNTSSGNSFVSPGNQKCKDFHQNKIVQDHHYVENQANCLTNNKEQNEKNLKNIEGSSVRTHNIKAKYSQNNTLMKSEALSDEVNNLGCSVCGIQLSDSNVLKMHLALIHNIDSSSPKTIINYQCHLCSKSFKMKGSLMVHFRVAHFGFFSGHRTATVVNNLKIKANVKEIADFDLDNIQKGDNKQWQCEDCKKFFTTKYFLKKHKRLHTGETPYSCSQCNKTFTFQQSYHKHLLYHNDEKPHCCSICGRAFKELSTLHNHQRIHTGEKPFSCETCGKSFRQRVSYLVHRRIHTGVMPYKCTACDKSFRYKVSQRTHKCQVQPPGIVIRQTGELIEKLMQKKVPPNPDMIQQEQKSNLMTKSSHNDSSRISYSEISNIHAELVRTGAKLSFEDTESENFNLLENISSDLNENIFEDEKIAQYNCNNDEEISHFDTHIDELIHSISVIEENDASSPSNILKSLCLSQDDMIS